jgi:hypothetical protein
MAHAAKADDGLHARLWSAGGCSRTPQTLPLSSLGLARSEAKLRGRLTPNPVAQAALSKMKW